MAVVVIERPAGSYTSTTTTTNATKYSTDSSLMNAISSGKVDGDMNKVVDAINDVASYNATGSYTGLEASVQQVKTNEDNIAALVSGTIPDNTYGEITVASSATVWTINDDVVTQVKMATDSVGTDEVIDANITTAKINDLAITEGKINALAVTEGKIGALAVTSGKIASDAVTTNKIINNAVSLDKMASGTAGNLIALDASGDPAYVATGTAGQSLKSNGAGAAPTFQVDEGGSWELIASATASASSSVDFASGITSAYSKVVVVFDSVYVSATSRLQFRISTDAGSTYKAGASDYHYQTASLRTSSYGFSQSNAATHLLSGGNDLITAFPISGFFEIYNPSNSGGTNVKLANWEVISRYSSTSIQKFNGGGAYKGTSDAIDGIRFLLNTGTLTTGNFYLYGVKNT